MYRRAGEVSGAHRHRSAVHEVLADSVRAAMALECYRALLDPQRGDPALTP